MVLKSKELKQHNLTRFSFSFTLYRKNIKDRSLNKLNDTKDMKTSLGDRHEANIGKTTIDSSNNIAKRIINQVKEELEA
jgi:hypothetical protein